MQVSLETEEGEKLRAAFPECFTEGHDEGGLRLSIVVMRAWEIGVGRKFAIEEALGELQVPFKKWDSKELREADAHLVGGHVCGSFRKKIDGSSGILFNATISINGSDFAVLSKDRSQEIILAPTSCFPYRLFDEWGLKAT
jgi:hypothetical protein